MIDERLQAVWKAIDELHEEVHDHQPSDKKVVAINLIGYLRNDLKYIAYKYGVKLA